MKIDEVLFELQWHLQNKSVASFSIATRFNTYFGMVSAIDMYRLVEPKLNVARCGRRSYHANLCIDALDGAMHKCMV